MNPVLGELISEKAERDAIHVAIAPVVANERLYPGQHIGFCEGSSDRVTSLGVIPIGIVDPFIRDSLILPETRFFMLLYPGTITSLRHEWEHPAFEKGSRKEEDKESYEWLVGFAARLGISFKELMDEEDGPLKGEYCFGDDDGPSTFREEWEEFALHYERHTGRRLTSNERQTMKDGYYRCAC